MFANQSPKPKVLVVGTYHFANPGRDVNNVHVDDVLAPARQEQLEQLTDALAKFKPTKIAIEAELGSEVIAKRYSDYLAGKYTLTRNEVDQIGFRLAKKLGLKSIECVDELTDFPWQRVINYAKANGRSSEIDAITQTGAKIAREDSEYIASHTVLDALRLVNSDARVADYMSFYYAAVRLSDTADEAGTDLMTAWYSRNIHIYRNIVGLIGSPNERILVIYGAGHLGLLRQDFSGDSSVKLRTLGEFIPNK